MKSLHLRVILAALVVITLFGVTAVFANAEMSKYAEVAVYQNEAGQIFFMPKDPQRSVRGTENSDSANEAAKNRVISIKIFERSMQLDRRK